MADASEAVAATPSRLAKIEVLATALHDAGPAEVTIAVAYLSGELPQRQIGVGWATLREAAPPAGTPTLTLTEVNAAFDAIGAVAGQGSVAARKALVDELFGRATAKEQSFLLRLLSGELHQGALEGVMAEAIARAAEVPAKEVRRALMLSGSMTTVAQTALTQGREGLRGFGLQVGRPIGPMLASSAPTIEDALAKITPAAVEWKMDGIRVQVHLRGGQARLFTRTLDEITGRLPDVVAELAKLPARDAVLDGELVALQEDGRPYPFQVTASRTSRRTGEPAAGLSTYLFDIVHLDGQDLIDRPGAERFEALARLVPERLRMPRLGQVPGGGAGGGLDQGQAPAPPGPGHPGRRVGPRPPPRLAVQPAPGGPRPGDRRLRHAGQDVQGPDRRDAHVADRAAAGSGELPGRLHRLRAAGTGRGDRLRWRAAQPPLPG